MIKRDIAVLVNIGINIITAVLCIPTEFPVLSSFYRAVILYIVNVFVIELPKWENKTRANTRIDKAQDVIFLLGFGLIAVGLLNITQPYDASALPQPLSVWVWLYFALSLSMLFLTVINSLEFHSRGIAKGAIPAVTSLDPAEKKKHK